MIKRVLTGVLFSPADVIPFPTGDDLEKRKKEAADPERIRSRRKWAERNKEKRERRDSNKRITDDLKRDRD